VAAVLTNTTPVGAFRGAGRPEAAALLERIMDMASVELGIDPVELRRRNFIQPEEFPYTTVVGAAYDNGDTDTMCDCGDTSAIYCPTCNRSCRLTLTDVPTYPQPGEVHQ